MFFTEMDTHKLRKKLNDSTVPRLTCSNPQMRSKCTCQFSKFADITRIQNQYNYE